MEVNGSVFECVQSVDVVNHLRVHMHVSTVEEHAIFSRDDNHLFKQHQSVPLSPTQHAAKPSVRGQDPCTERSSMHSTVPARARLPFQLESWPVIECCVIIHLVKVKRVA